MKYCTDYAKSLSTPEQVLKAFKTPEELNTALHNATSTLSRCKGPRNAKKRAVMEAYVGLLRETKASLNGSTGKAKPSTQLTEEDIAQLTYEQADSKLQSIRSKKSTTRWLTEKEGDNDQFRNAVAIEQMLLAHMSTFDASARKRVSKATISDILAKADSDKKFDVAAALRDLID